jgi:hypothetical protein
MLKKTFLLLLIVTLYLNNTEAQTFTIAKTSNYKGQKILLLQNSNMKQLIFYKTPLRVNSDGSPMSYSPKDLRGDSLTYNLIMNGVAIYRKSDSFCISVPNKDTGDYNEKYKKLKKRPSDFTPAQKKEMVQTAYSVFQQFINSDYSVQPAEYEIFWRSVLVDMGNGKPCEFASGPFKGYFGSKTAVNNGLTSNKGECNCNNFLDAAKIPALVLPGGNNPLKIFGAKLEDIVIAYNKNTNQVSYAIIGDIGPGSNLGEGSMAMNGQLLNTHQFVTKAKWVRDSLNINNNILFAIVPLSKSYKLQKPYSADNIKVRCLKWLEEVGFKTEQDFITFMKNKAEEL